MAAVIIGAICVGLWILFAVLLYKIVKKVMISRNIERFKIQCYAVASEVCYRCDCDECQLKGYIDNNIDKCEKEQGANREEIIIEAYRCKDYRQFVYICAHDLKQQAISDYCALTYKSYYYANKQPSYHGYFDPSVDAIAYAAVPSSIIILALINKIADAVLLFF